MTSERIDSAQRRQRPGNAVSQTSSSVERGPGPERNSSVNLNQRYAPCSIRSCSCQMVFDIQSKCAYRELARGAGVRQVCTSFHTYRFTRNGSLLDKASGGQGDLQEPGEERQSTYCVTTPDATPRKTSLALAALNTSLRKPSTLL